MVVVVRRPVEVKSVAVIKIISSYTNCGQICNLQSNPGTCDANTRMSDISIQVQSKFAKRPRQACDIKAISQLEPGGDSILAPQVKRLHSIKAF